MPMRQLLLKHRSHSPGRGFPVEVAVLVCGLAILLAACGKKPETVMLPGEANILARVNKTPITEFDVDHAIKERLGPGTLRIIDDVARRKVLESLVLTRALALSMQAELKTGQQLEIDAAVDAYRELLLAKQYINLKAAPAAITEAKLKDYYQKHPDLYGRESTKYFELLKGKRTDDTRLMQRMLTALKDSKEKPTEEWQRFNHMEGADITYFAGKLKEGLFSPRLQVVLDGLEEGASSDLIFVKRIPYVARISRVETAPAKPFAEVRDQIMERARLLEIKKAASEIKKTVLEKAEIEFTTGRKG